MPIRHQLAAYSPISLGACARATASALRLTGDPRLRLSELLRREYDAEAVVLCGSGTQALQLAILAAMGVAGERTPVAFPAFSCFDIASAAVGADVSMALYDMDPDTLGPDLESLERVLNAGARVVVIAPLYGTPVAWDEIEALAGRFGAVLIEDAAQGQGASLGGRKLGTLGRISTLSFGRGKGWTGGNGGAVLFRRGVPSSLVGLRPIGTVGEVKAAIGLFGQWLLGRPSIYGIPRSIPALHLGVTTYHAPTEPRQMTRAGAAAVLGNSRRSSEEADLRRTKAVAIYDRVRGHADLSPIRLPTAGISGQIRLAIRWRGGVGEALGDVTRRLGVERSYPVSLQELPQVGARLDGPERSWPGARRLVDELITIPTHSRVTDSDIDRILAQLRVPADPR